MSRRRLVTRCATLAQDTAIEVGAGSTLLIGASSLQLINAAVCSFCLRGVCVLLVSDACVRFTSELVGCGGCSQSVRRRAAQVGEADVESERGERRTADRHV